MSTSRRILFVASEAVPFCKTGGLADVMGSLPKVLWQMGHDVRVVIPRYQKIDQGRFRFLPLMPEMNVLYGGVTFHGSVLRCSYPGTEMPVYLIDQPEFFGREELYGASNKDYLDNNRRFAFFNMATLWLLKGLDWQPDIIHCNDWQTGLVPALLAAHPIVSEDPFYQDIKSVFSIHNLAYQGNFDKFTIPEIGLPWEVFTEKGLEFYGKASFLKSGLMFSDKLIAVSPTYAEEIQVDGQGAGMEGSLRLRSEDLHGILNGIDTSVWSPSEDANLHASYSRGSIAGKAKCKADLQKNLGLPVKKDVPLIGMISRLIEAKGFDLVVDALDELEELDAQFVILGSGDTEIESKLFNAARRNPEKFAVHIGYDDPLSHRIIGGADMFLMPSFYEPCGLTQMYAMRYGTIPIVRRTGGLSDSVFQADKLSIESGKGTGYLFESYTKEEMLKSIYEALTCYQDSKSWKQLQQNAMDKDFSWIKSAKEYSRLYEELLLEDEV